MNFPKKMRKTRRRRTPRVPRFLYLRAPKPKHIKEGHPNIGHALNKGRRKHFKEGAFIKPSATLIRSAKSSRCYQPVYNCDPNTIPNSVPYYVNFLFHWILHHFINHLLKTSSVPLRLNLPTALQENIVHSVLLEKRHD